MLSALPAAPHSRQGEGKVETNQNRGEGGVCARGGRE